MIKQKLSWANGHLAKVRYYLSPKLLRTLYFCIFETHLRYGCQIWGQHRNHNLNDISNLQRIINFIINELQFELSTSKTNKHYGSTFQRNKNYDMKRNNKIRKLSFGLTSHRPMPAFKSKKVTNNWKWPSELQYSKLSQLPACSSSSKKHQL